jgi:hypothetical protein
VAIAKRTDRRPLLPASRPSSEAGEYQPPGLAALTDLALELDRPAIEASSERTYRYVRRRYETFCENQAYLDPCAPTSLRLYLAGRLSAGEPPTTLRTRVAGIRHLLQEANAGRAGHERIPDPTEDAAVRRTLANVFRKLRAEPRRATAAVYEMLAPLVAAAAPEAIRNERLRESLRLRDRALVLFGFVLGRRGSEFARVDLEHIDRPKRAGSSRSPGPRPTRPASRNTSACPAFPTIRSAPSPPRKPGSPMPTFAAARYSSRSRPSPAAAVDGAPRRHRSTPPSDRRQRRARRLLALALPPARRRHLRRAAQLRPVPHPNPHRVEKRCDVLALRRSSGQNSTITTPRDLPRDRGRRKPRRTRSIMTLREPASHGSQHQ